MQPWNPWWLIRSPLVKPWFVATFVAANGSTLLEIPQGAWTAVDIARIGTAARRPSRTGSYVWVGLIQQAAKRTPTRHGAHASIRQCCSRDAAPNFSRPRAGSEPTIAPARDEWNQREQTRRRGAGLSRFAHSSHPHRESTHRSRGGCPCPTHVSPRMIRGARLSDRRRLCLAGAICTGGTASWDIATHGSVFVARPSRR